MQKIIVKVNKVRIDKYLVDEIKESRSIIAKMIINNFILVNGQTVKANTLVKENDEITILDGFSLNEDINPVEMDLDIIYEDDDLMVINKPSGLVVHPGSGNYDNTLVNGLMHYTNSLSDINGQMRPGIVHRIDKDTSGLLLVAKNNKVHNLLADGFKNKTIKREYIALLEGILPHNTATVDAPIGRDKSDRKKMCVTNDNAKSAITHLKVLKRYKNNTLVSLNLETGRTHQIRVHMKYIGYPVFNDPIYTNKKSDEFGQFLHSSKLDFIHPISKKEMHFEVNVPQTFQVKLEELENEL